MVSNDNLLSGRSISRSGLLAMLGAYCSGYKIAFEHILHVVDHYICAHQSQRSTSLGIFRVCNHVCQLELIPPLLPIAYCYILNLDTMTTRLVFTLCIPYIWPLDQQHQLLFRSGFRLKTNFLKLRDEVLPDDSSTANCHPLDVRTEHDFYLFSPFRS